MIRHGLLIVALIFLCAADPSSYDAVCQSVCMSLDGATSLPPGTVLMRPLWDGVTTYNPTDGAGNLLSLIPTSNPPTPLYAPPKPPPTTIAPLDFMARLTPSEQTAITTAGQTNVQIMLFLFKLAGAQEVDVTDPMTVAGVGAMVTVGLFTQQRAAQILNLSTTSP